MRTGLLAIFVLSGFAGLIYQSIWSHYLGLFLGHAAYAQALVLAIFMGGMAIGAAWIARAGQRWRNLIRGYAIIEAVIGVLGLLFHTLFTSVAAFSYDTLIPALGEPWTVNLARWLIAAALILPQTILLGMTFPLMSGGLIRRYSGSDGHTLGGLYFTNSIGAAIGALVAVFVLIPSIGLPGAMTVAGVLNFVVAGLAWWLARDPEPEISSHSTSDNNDTQKLARNPLLRVVLFSTALSGAASFAYEIIWIRMLSMAVGSTMHAFELMLASFIAGIALGGLWVRTRADTTESPLRLTGWMQVFMGVAALASLAVYANTFAWVGWLMQALAKTDSGYSVFNLGTATIAIAIMLPAAFFAGTTLPLFTVALLRSGQGERSIGRVYAWNTLGSIVGVFAAIHLLIPNLGLKLSLCIAALVDMGVGLVLLRMHASNRRDMFRFGIGAALVAAALIVAVRIPFDPMTVASGVFRHGRASLQAADEVVFYRDGKTASVAAIMSKQGTLQIATNGKTDAAIQMHADKPASLDEPTMVLAAALPLSMHATPHHVGVIGFGSGLTTHALLGDPRVQRVDTIEIEPAMVAGARPFGPRVERAYTDPRSHIVIDDAKSYFSGQRSKYDVIISEPSNPWISGVGALFSKEFYEFVPRHLNEDGLFLQWVQLYEIDDALVSSILRGLTPAFSDYSAWLSNASDLLIVATPKGKLPALDLQSLLNAPNAREDLARLGITNTQQLAFRQIADAKVLRAVANMHPTQRVNSDYFPVLGLEAPKARFKGVSADTLLTMSVVNRPLLEALGVGSVLAETVVPPSLPHFVADGLTVRARGYAQELRGNTVDQSTSTVTVLSAVRDCSKTWTMHQQRMLMISLSDLADRTIKYLPPSMLEGVWVRPKWLTCDTLPADVMRALKLFEAHSLRDYPRMAVLGQEWLKNRPQDSQLARLVDGYAWSGILLHAVAEKRWGDLTEVVNRMEESKTIHPEFGFLKAIARGLAQEANR
jgi:predicted membrane-bound spermidine synthase